MNECMTWYKAYHIATINEEISDKRVFRDIVRIKTLYTISIYTVFIGVYVPAYIHYLKRLKEAICRDCLIYFKNVAS